MNVSGAQLVRRCTKCGETKPADKSHFYANPGGKYGLTPRCKPCVNADNTASHARRLARDPERVRKLANERSKRAYAKDLEKSRAQARAVAARARQDEEKRAKINMRKRAGGAGITAEQFAKMLSDQGGVCAICRTDEPSKHAGAKGWNIDHCHKTRKVRFILCNACNRGLAAFRDNSMNLMRAASLLQSIQCSEV